MGWFSNKNVNTLGTVNTNNIAADMSYQGTVGALEMAYDSMQTECEIFNEMVQDDINEIAAIKQGFVDESGFLDSIKEKVKEISERIKELARKIWAKVKALYDTFIAKITILITKDNKKLVDKYWRTVSTKDLSNMTYDWRTKLSGAPKLPSSESTFSDAFDRVTACNGPEEMGKVEESIDEEYPKNFFKEILGEESTENTFVKDFVDKTFAESTEKTGLSSSDLTFIKSTLTDARSAIKDVQDDKSNAEKMFNTYIKQIDNHISKLTDAIKNNKAYSDKDNAGTLSVGNSKAHYGNNSESKDEKELMMKKLVLINKIVTKTQSLYSKAVDGRMAVTKLNIAQCRAAFTKAITYKPSAPEESKDAEKVAAESAFDEVYSSFACYVAE